MSENGDIANWKIPGKWLRNGGDNGFGTSSREHYCGYDDTNRQGESKILKKCRLPNYGSQLCKKNSNKSCSFRSYKEWI